MASHVNESIVLDFKISEAWETVRDLNLSFLSTVASCTVDAGSSWSAVGSLRTVTYKDGTVQSIKLVERSDVTHELSWDLVTSNPPAHALSVGWTLKLTAVNWPSTAVFLEWTCDYSKDASAAVLADAKYKATDFFAAVKSATKARLIAAANASASATGSPALMRQLSTRGDLMRAAFKSFDTNADGKLQFEEFAVCVNKVLGMKLPEAALRIILMEADLDGSGDIDFEEFIEFLGGQPVPTADSKSNESAAAPPKK